MSTRWLLNSPGLSPEYDSLNTMTNDNGIIDAHTHFWDPKHLNYPWLESVPALQPTYGLTEFNTATKNIPVEKMVFIECNCEPTQSPQEIAWIKELAREDPRLCAGVAYADLLNENTINETLDAYESEPFVRGIRHNIQGHAEGFALQPAFINGINAVAARDMHFELCLTGEQLGEVLALVGQLNDVRLIVNHCAKPAIKSNDIDPWRAQIKELASCENIHCKLSGLLTETDMKTWSFEQLETYALHVVECFGIDRVVFGSDWPVLTLAGSYGDWYEFTQQLTCNWSSNERRAFYHDNAARFYRLF